jgi:hypothetical protein
MAQAHDAKVVMRLIQENKFLAPLKSTSFKWKIDQTSVWWFHAVPRNNQTSYPQTIKIDEVRISAEKSSSPTVVKFFAHIKVKNLTPPNPPDFPHQDGCHFDLYVAVASPI